ncbi:hypothetical protein [Clostridium sp. DJ247]|uniref:hypothetical protein n=1 Tax=Clostridium sp. DJ247 TaxID=2726188 RepID=UPI001624BFE1|nr:hypothetical protein [Clostridium sp. DJ247]MBC2581265.1 hypothetical protein [Clostridium sp. DJ247]
MKEDSLKLAQKDIDEALTTIEAMEENISNSNLSKENLKEKFVFLSEKIQQLEKILIEEGILE